MSNVDEAQRILRTNSRILFGIFGTVESSGYFPPLNFLNEFFLEGSDPCDQDGRMFKWKPFKLAPDEYVALKDWWIDSHPDAIEDPLGETCWSDWIQRIIDNYDE